MSRQVESATAVSSPSRSAEPLDASRLRQLVDAGRVCSAARLWLQAARQTRHTDVPKSRSAFKSALALARRGDDARLLAITSNSLAWLETSEQNLGRALSLNAAAQHFWHRAGELSDLFRSRYEYGLLLFFMGRYSDAEATLSGLLETLEGYAGAREALSASVLTILGRIKIATQDYQQAETFLTQALAARPPENRAGHAASLDALCRLRIHQRRFRDAKELIEAVLSLTRGDPRKEANALATYGEIHLGLERAEAAIQSAHQARTLLQDSQSEDPNLDLHTYHIEALANRMLGNGEIADARMEALLARLESFRQLEQGDLHIPFVAHRREYFSSWIEQLAEQGRFEEAFEVAEWVRARSLLDRLVWPPAQLRHRVPHRLVEREYELRSELANIARWIEDSPADDVDRLDRLAASARRLRIALMANEAEMRRAAGAISQRPIGFRDAQKLLNPNTVLLSFWLGDENGLMWIVERDELAVVTDLPDRRSLRRSVHRLRELIESPKSSRGALDREIEALSLALLEPLFAHLDYEPRALIVVPDGPLAEAPFSALRWTFAGEDSPSYLAERIPVVMAHSLSVIAAIRARARARESKLRLTLTAVGDSVYAADDPRVRPDVLESPFRSAKDHLRLTWSGWELRRISSRLAPTEVRVLAGLDASREHLLEGCLSDSRFVHIGAHAEFDREDPSLSAIYLSSFDPGGRGVDGALRLHDFEQLDLSADLVVLAACESGVGRTYSSEGAVALPRAVLLAGAASVIASLWQIDDEPTALFMDRFWEAHLDWGLPALMAMNEAQLSLIHTNKWRHPTHWAGFTLLGDWQL